MNFDFQAAVALKAGTVLEIYKRVEKYFLNIKLSILVKYVIINSENCIYSSKEKYF